MQTKCLTCEKGRYQDDLNSPWCKKCPAGWAQPKKKTTECTACPIGQSLHLTGELRCEDCTTGKYGDVTGLPLCKTCPGGTFQENTGVSLPVDSGGCNSCPSGWFNLHEPGGLDNSKRNSNCIRPSMNEFASCAEFDEWKGVPVRREGQCDGCIGGEGHNSSFCFDCWRTNGGFDTCQQCPAGWFQALDKQLGCEKCPAGYSQNESASSACKGW